MDLKGQKFGRLLVVDKFIKETKCGCKQAYWRCKCECGQVTVVNQGSLRSGKTKSCGCLRVDKVNAMLARRRGDTITLCDEQSFIDQCKEKFGADNVKVVDAPHDALNKEQYWIRVSDRLPENGQRVIFLSESRPFWRIHVGDCFLRPDNSYVFTEGYLEPVQDVLCWIPEPKHQEDE